jgi:low temperature requirement protein LtrA
MLLDGSKRHVFTYGHLPCQLGLALSGAGTAVAITAGDRPPAPPIAAAVFGGMALYLLAMLTVRLAFVHRFDGPTVVRLTGTLAVVALGVAAVRLPAYAGLIALAAILVAVTAAESPFHRGR